jgi:hypothetical protein
MTHVIRVFKDYLEAVAYRNELKLLGFETELIVNEDGTQTVRGTRHGEN